MRSKSTRFRDRRPHIRARGSVTAISVALALTTACGGGFVDTKEIVTGLANLFVPERAAVAYGDGRFVTVGKWGITVSDNGGLFRNLPDTGFLSWAVAYGSSGWVAVDTAALLTSPDGLSWDRAPLPLDVGYGAAFGIGRYVVVGTGGAIVVSEDARNWQSVASPTQQDLLGVSFVGDRFLAVGRGGSATASFDGLTWSLLELPTSVTLRGVASGDGVIVVTGDRGTLLRSADGESWRSVRTPSKAYLTQAAFGAGRMVVVGAFGTILISDDGANTFQAVAVDFGDSGLDIPNHLNGVTYGGGQFVAVGKTILLSPDGHSWVAATSEHTDEAPEPEPENEQSEIELGT